MALSVIQEPTEPTRDTKPKSWREALPPKYEKDWRPAFKRQLEELAYTETWDLVDLPPGETLLPGKWVLDQKFDPNGIWMKNRARWVVCGNKEKAVYEWFEVFSAVAHLTSLRLFLAVVAIQDLECHAFNIVTAFLNANIPPGFNIYIRQPSGFEDGSGRACKLKKALYGLRLSPILWLETLTTALREMGFEPKERSPNRKGSGLVERVL